MRAVIQRVSSASVLINNRIVSEIGVGLVIFLGIELKDTNEDSLWLSNKIAKLRIFSDSEGKMNNSIIDVGAQAIVVSQFTLHAKTKKGNRPSYINAADSKNAVSLYRQFKKDLTKLISQDVLSGEFGADMQVGLVNDGPVTIIIDTKNKE